jgi:hypothetical protein
MYLSIVSIIVTGMGLQAIMSNLGAGLGASLDRLVNITMLGWDCFVIEYWMSVLRAKDERSWAQTCKLYRLLAFPFVPPPKLNDYLSLSPFVLLMNLNFYLPTV